jgi:hypothetical protein
MTTASSALGLPLPPCQAEAYDAVLGSARHRLGRSFSIEVARQSGKNDLSGDGRLLNPSQLTLLRGADLLLDPPTRGETPFGCLDVVGEGLNPSPDTERGGIWGKSAAAVDGHDSTVLTNTRVNEAERGEIPGSTVAVVTHHEWGGKSHSTVEPSVLGLARRWAPYRLTVDATGIGQPLASRLAVSLRVIQVEALKLTPERKSQLGFDLLSAIGCLLRLCAEARPSGTLFQRGERKLRECVRQLEGCRAIYRPNWTLNFFVDERDGHDDYVVSLPWPSAPRHRLGPDAKESQDIHISEGSSRERSRTNGYRNTHSRGPARPPERLRYRTPCPPRRPAGAYELPRHGLQRPPELSDLSSGPLSLR